MFDLLTLPFELLGESVECMVGCVIGLLIACCVLGVVALVILT